MCENMTTNNRHELTGLFRKIRTRRKEMLSSGILPSEIRKLLKSRDYRPSVSFTKVYFQVREREGGQYEYSTMIGLLGPCIDAYWLGKIFREKNRKIYNLSEKDILSEKQIKKIQPFKDSFHDYEEFIETSKLIDDLDLIPKTEEGDREKYFISLFIDMLGFDPSTHKKLVDICNTNSYADIYNKVKSIYSVSDDSRAQRKLLSGIFSRTEKKEARKKELVVGFFEEMFKDKLAKFQNSRDIHSIIKYYDFLGSEISKIKAVFCHILSLIEMKKFVEDELLSDKNYINDEVNYITENFSPGKEEEIIPKLHLNIIHKLIFENGFDSTIRELMNKLIEQFGISSSVDEGVLKHLIDGVSNFKGRHNKRIATLFEQFIESEMLRELHPRDVYRLLLQNRGKKRLLKFYLSKRDVVMADQCYIVLPPNVGSYKMSLLSDLVDRRKGREYKKFERVKNREYDIVVFNPLVDTGTIDRYVFTEEDENRQTISKHIIEKMGADERGILVRGYDIDDFRSEDPWSWLLKLVDDMELFPDIIFISHSYAKNQNVIDFIRNVKHNFPEVQVYITGVDSSAAENVYKARGCEVDGFVKDIPSKLIDSNRDNGAGDKVNVEHTADLIINGIMQVIDQNEP